MVAAERRTFAGPARYLDDPANRAALATYLADLTGAGSAPQDGQSDDGQSDGGQSYGEMAEALIAAVVPAGEPVDLLVLAYSIHDVQPGRATATYLSSVCPGTPLSFAICDQGSAAAFTGLRIVQDYRADPGRVLLIVLEQAGLPYPVAAPRPARHRGVALLFEREVVAGAAGPRLVGLRQRPGLAAAEVAQQASADLAELSADYRQVRVLANPALAGRWPGQPADRLRVGPADQPATGLCWQLLDELADGQPDLVVAADYDPDLGYLCLAAFEPR